MFCCNHVRAILHKVHIILLELYTFWYTPCRPSIITWWFAHFTLLRLPWRYESKTKVVKQGTHSLSGEYLHQIWKGSFQWKESYCLVHCPIFFPQSHEQIANSWTYGLEDKGEGYKLLYKTHFLLMMNICTKYEKDSSNRNRATCVDMMSFSDMWSHEQMTLKTWVIHDTPPLSGEYLYQVWKVQTYQQMYVRIA